METTEIALTRLMSQQLVGSRFTSPGEIVSYMGAIQAQDYPMAKWAIGLRLPGCTDVDVEAAITHGDLLRTHLLRPTWHYVSPKNIAWLIDLTAPQIIAGQRGRDRQLELNEQVYSHANRIIEHALSQEGHLRRDQLISRLNQAGIATDQNRASHLFMRAELHKIICSGATQSGKTTYALFSERVPQPRTLSHDEALAELARRYFTSRCPATLQDFAWWSGLRAKDASRAVQLLGHDFLPETIAGRNYWLPDSCSAPASFQRSVLLLPPFDEFMLSYADRSFSVTTSLEKHMKAISDRGIFRPIIVIDGQVLGIWKRSFEKGAVRVLIQPFQKLEKAEQDLITQTAGRFAHFLGVNLELEDSS